MELIGESTLLRIFIGEMDKLKHRPLYEVITEMAKTQGLAGATVLRGLLGYGASSQVHTFKLLELSTDLPIIIEIIDKTEKINQFLPSLKALFTTANVGGLVTLEKVNVIHYIAVQKE
ncbi:DUF190 domain-containing protein [Beggiatoa leptomitoformis]|uniref:DUF190 domain-containing protein n=1 Tax=Beggiatoa leptomitoformis TaxID=288004 RepID=A0A2N9YFR3_9GAMM|nr:DUF190 domain-containing protein [Beggiatoa leptomitoformis]ALG68347.1 DUF190 domain-containing protein [Beggiatoa leptomitoformis]AUI69334.1 DUF190 domain-containing protein [Beggiatoa leptomitoformis]